MPSNATHVTPGDAAGMLGIATESVRRYCDSGLLDYVKTKGGHRRISRESIAALKARRTVLSSTVAVVGGA